MRRLRIEPGGRLVENRNLGLLDDDLGKAEPLAHAARECRDPLVRDIEQPHPRQRRGDPLRPLRGESPSASPYKTDSRPP